jgi:hypothetical protein
LIITAKAVSEGMDEVINAMKTGVLCFDVHDAWGIEIS